MHEILHGIRLPDFMLTKIEFQESQFFAKYLSRYQDTAAFHQMSLILHVTRRPEYYLTRIVSVIVFLLMMAGGVFFVTPEDLPNRFNLTLTLFLTAVAFHFVVAADLPKISYATRLDKFLAFMYVLLSLTALEHIIANRLTRKYDPDSVADTLDLAAIITYYVILTLGTLWFVKPMFDRTDAELSLNPVIQTTKLTEQEKEAQEAAGVGAVAMNVPGKERGMTLFGRQPSSAPAGGSGKETAGDIALENLKKDED